MNLKPQKTKVHLLKFVVNCFFSHFYQVCISKRFFHSRSSHLTCTSHRWVAIDIKVSQTVLCICNTTWPRVRLYRFLVKLVRSWKSTPFPGKSERSLRHRQSLALDANNASFLNSEDFWTCTTVSAFWLEVAAPHTSMCALYCQPPSLSPVQVENPSKQHVPHNTWSNI